MFISLAMVSWSAESSTCEYDDDSQVGSTDMRRPCASRIASESTDDISDD